MVLSSLQKTKNGTYRLQFRSLNRPQSVSLGKVRKTEAESFQLHVDRLIRAANGAGTLEAVDLQWINDRSPDVKKRLKECGLIQDDTKPDRSFVSSVDDFVATMKNWSASTATNWEQHRRRVFQYFANRPAASITAGDARDFKQFLVSSLNLSENTARKTIASCRQVFKWLMDHEQATRNPFAGLPVGIGKTSKQTYVSADVVERILPHCPNYEWRLMFILARYAGLRCPSEPFALRWSSIDFEALRMRVFAPKTKQTRVVPLFPELRKHLAAIHAELSEGCSDWLMPNLRETSGSLHGPAFKIVQRANEKLWPRLFHNMRSSCQTDLTDKHPISAVCTWLGNTADVAAKHYLQVTESHFEAATRADIIPAPRRQSADIRHHE